MYSIESFIQCLWYYFENDWYGSQWHTQHAGEFTQWASWRSDVQEAFLYPEQLRGISSPLLMRIQQDAPTFQMPGSPNMWEHPLLQLMQYRCVRINGCSPLLPSTVLGDLTASLDVLRVLLALCVTLWSENVTLTQVQRLFSNEYHTVYADVLNDVTHHAALLDIKRDDHGLLRVHCVPYADVAPDRVQLHLLDCDGALYNQSYFDYLTTRVSYPVYTIGPFNFSYAMRPYASHDPLIAANGLLLRSLCAVPSDVYSELWFGTNRQTVLLDLFNSHKECHEERVAPELAHFAVPKLAQYLNKPFRHVTMENLWRSDLPVDLGARVAHYQRYFATTPGSISAFLEEDSTLFDSTKISWIYRVAQEAAATWLGHEIALHLYDDRLDILRVLRTYFQRYPEDLPAGISLYLHVYNGKELYVVGAPVKGGGVLNHAWPRAAKKMQRIIGCMSRTQTATSRLDDASQHEWCVALYAQIHEVAQDEVLVSSVTEVSRVSKASVLTPLSVFSQPFVERREDVVSIMPVRCQAWL